MVERLRDLVFIQAVDHRFISVGQNVLAEHDGNPALPRKQLDSLGEDPRLVAELRDFLL